MSKFLNAASEAHDKGSADNDAGKTGDEIIQRGRPVLLKQLNALDNRCAAYQSGKRAPALPKKPNRYCQQGKSDEVQKEVILALQKAMIRQLAIENDAIVKRHGQKNRRCNGEHHSHFPA